MRGGLRPHSQSRYPDIHKPWRRRNQHSIRLTLLRRPIALTHAHDEINQLIFVISNPRFGTYLNYTGGNVERALQLYEWNIMVSSAFIMPLHMCEIAVRNGVVEAVGKVHGQRWPWSSGFRRSLPRPSHPRKYNPEQDLISVSSRLQTAGKIIAELKFAFWEKLFTAGQDLRLWTPYLSTAFPGAPAGLPISVVRQKAFDNLRGIRAIRNRIAHHEPIFTRNILNEYQIMHEMIKWRSPVAAEWVDRKQTVTSLISLKP
jgi:hypothetical protein